MRKKELLVRTKTAFFLLVSFCLAGFLLVFVLSSPGIAQEESDDDVEVTADIVPKPPSSPSPPSKPRPSNPVPSDDAPIYEIGVDAEGKAESPTSAVVRGEVTLPSDCWLHYDDNPEDLSRVVGPEETDKDLNVYFYLHDLVPDTTYYYRVEAHSKEHRGLTSWSELKQLKTPDLSSPDSPGERENPGEGGGELRGGNNLWWVLFPPSFIVVFLFFIWRRRRRIIIKAPIEGVLDWLIVPEKGTKFTKGQSLLQIDDEDSCSLVITAPQKGKVVKRLAAAENGTVVAKDDSLLKIVLRTF